MYCVCVHHQQELLDAVSSLKVFDEGDQHRHNQLIRLLRLLRSRVDEDFGLGLEVSDHDCRSLDDTIILVNVLGSWCASSTMRGLTESDTEFYPGDPVVLVWAQVRAVCLPLWLFHQRRRCNASHVVPSVPRLSMSAIPQPHRCQPLPS